MRRPVLASVRCPRCGKPFPRSRYGAPRMALQVHLNLEHTRGEWGRPGEMLSPPIRGTTGTALPLIRDAGIRGRAPAGKHRRRHTRQSIAADQAQIAEWLLQTDTGHERLRAGVARLLNENKRGPAR